ncbi:hypothetical protein INR49_023213, partial [Caranx melampygus]
MISACLRLPGDPSGRLYPGLRGGHGGMSSRHRTLPVETTEKIYVFAADRQQVDDWTHRLCEIAFPMNGRRWVKRGSLHRGSRVEEDEGMEDNSLYSGRETFTPHTPVQTSHLCLSTY